jgi:putative mRNA 3-end processing factor
MRLHYQRANPDVGDESLLLRFEGLLPDRTVCILVNSGRGVHVDELIDESRGEYLGGIIVTNAHPEYYCTLGENVREETPIYAAPDTVTILAELLTEPHARNVERRDAVLEQLVSANDWSQLVHGLRIHPVPSGHAPGTAGFLFEITDEEDIHTLFLADEFTTRQAAGYPGIDLDFPVEVDALLVSGATDEEFTPTLTETLSTICERVRDNSTVLVTADEPTGIHAAYMLGHLGKQLESPFPITATGRTATLCEQLGFSIPNVATLSEYDAPEDVLTPGTVTIADPNAPVQGVSGQLFATLADDPDAAVVRLTTGAATPTSAARCTVQSFPWHNYPDRETLDTVVDALAPVQVVTGDRYGAEKTDAPFDPEYDSFVWTVDDDLVYTLYDGQGWVAPAEVDPDSEEQIRQRASDHRDVVSLSEYEMSLSLPTRREDADLAAEGLALDAVRDRLDSEAGSWRSSGGRSKTTSATDGGATTIDASLASLHEQINEIESTVVGRTYQASVVDAGGDVCLFRVQNPPSSFDHGQDVTLVLDPGDNAPTMSESKENGDTTDTTNATDDSDDADSPSDTLSDI